MPPNKHVCDQKGIDRTNAVFSSVIFPNAVSQVR